MSAFTGMTEKLFSLIKRSSKWKKVLFCMVLFFFCFIVFCMIFTFYSCYTIGKYEKDIYTENALEKMPEFQYCMVLGTSRTLKNGRENLYFRYRMEAVLLLYKRGKCKKIIVSGDNSRKEYDEASDMYDFLVSHGVKAEDIAKDYAGFRTLDSVLRMRNVFKLQKFVIVSQKMHCMRAVYIGRSHALDVAGFEAKDIPFTYHYMGKVREILAGNKAVLDIWTGKKPYFEY